MNLLEMIIVLSITVGVTIINYLIYGSSKLSPCYIEFDSRRRSEMKLMREYNDGFKKVFLMYLGTTTVITFFMLISYSWFVALVLMAVQLVYTVGATLIMVWMYVRSKLYWELEFKKEEKVKASQVCDACVV